MVLVGASLPIGRGKLSYLIGVGPKPEDPIFKNWDEEDHVLVMEFHDP